MSRVGKKPILIPEGVKVTINGQDIAVLGPKGELKNTVHELIKVELKDNNIIVSEARENMPKKLRGLWGLWRALIANMVEGVSKGYEKKLEIEGVGFKASVQGDKLVLNVGYVHPVEVIKPAGVTFLAEKNLITVSGPDKEKVGRAAAEIRDVKRAEPYKGKGIKYQGEKIRRKEGKKVVASKK